MDSLGPLALTIAQGIGAFQFFLPKLSDVRKTDKSNVDMAGDVRLGEVASVVLCLGVGTMVSAITKSPLPVYGAAATSILLICVYETALRGNRPGDPHPSRMMGERMTSDA